MTETLTIVLKADGTGLTGTIRTSANEIRLFGQAVDQAGKQSATAGNQHRKAARDIDELDRSATRTRGTLREMASGLTSVRGTLAALGISYVARELLGAGLAMDRFESSTAAALGSQTLAGRELAFVRQEANRLGLYFPTLAEGYAGLAASTRGTTLAGKETREIFLGIVEAGRSMNLSNQNVAGILNAVQQIASKNVVSMEELRQQLGDRLPGAMQIAARSMGYTVAEFVKLVGEGKILSADLLPKLARGLRDASAAGVELTRNSPAAQFERLRTVIFDVGVAVSRGGVLQTLANGASVLTTVLQSLVSSGAIQTITGLMVKLAVAGAVFYAGGLLQRGLGYLVAQFLIARGPVAGFGVALASSAAGAQGLTVRMWAAASATRGLAAATAFVQANPVMLVVTALTLLVTWLYTSREAARAAADELREGFRSAKQALEEFNKTPSLDAVFSLGDAKVVESIENIRQKLEDLREEQEALSRQQGRMVARFGYADPSIAQGLEQNTEAMDRYRIQLTALEVGQDRASNSVTDLVLKMTGIQRVSPSVRAELKGISREMTENGWTAEEAAPKFQAVIEKYYGIDTAARVSAVGIAQFSAALSGSQKLLDDHQKRMETLSIRMEELRGGVGAGVAKRWDIGIDKELSTAGGGDIAKGRQYMSMTGELQKLMAARAADIAASKAAEQQDASAAAARKASAAATRDSTRAVKDHSTELKQQREAQVRYASEAERATAEMAGPLKVAETEHSQRVAQLTKELNAHNMAQADFNTLKAASETQLKSTTDALKRDADVTGRVRADYGQLIELSRLSADARRVEEQVIRAVAEAEQEANRQRDESIRMTPAQIEALREFIRTSEDVVRVNEEQVQITEDLKGAWVSAADSASRAFGDWFSRGLKGGKDFARSLKDIFKRLVSDVVTIMAQQTLVKPFQNWLTGIAQGGFGQQQAAGSGGGLFGSIMSLFGGNSNGAQGGGFLQSLFGASQGQAQGQDASALSRLFGGAQSGQTGAGDWSTPPIYQGIGWGGQSAPEGTGSTGSGFGMGSTANPWMAGIAGAIYGWQQSGDTPGRVLGAASYGAAGFGVAAGVGAGAAALGAGAGIAGAATAGLAAIPVVGWIALAAIVVDKISGGKLFGTKFSRDSAAMQLNFGGEGITGATTIKESRQQSLFRGRTWRTTTKALDAEAQAAVDDLFKQLSQTVTEAAQTLGVQAPTMLAATFRQEFDKKGNLKSEWGTIAGKVYKEAQEVFVKRLLSENLINVAKLIGDAAEIDKIAEGYRSSADNLSEFATVILAIQHDIKNATALWTGRGEGMLTSVVTLVERMGRGGETMVETYQRITAGAMEYGNLIAGVDKDIRLRGLNDYQRAQVDIELQYRDQVKQANALARALGLSGARSQDLAKIEELRAIRMAELQKQMEAQRNAMLLDMSLSELSPLRDEQKLGEAMKGLRLAVTAGDMQRVQQLSQQALGFGRNLYASGADYNALYAEVTQLVSQVSEQSLMGLTETQLTDIADILTDLPLNIAREIFTLLLQANPPPVTPPPPPPPSNTGTGNNGNNNGNNNRDNIGNNDTNRKASDLATAELREVVALLQKIALDSASTAKATARSAEEIGTAVLRSTGAQLS